MYLALNGEYGFAQRLSFESGGLVAKPGDTIQISPRLPYNSLYPPLHFDWPNASPAIVYLQDTVEGEWKIKFDLPEFLVNENGQDSIQCSYTDSSALAASECDYGDRNAACDFWNPRTSHLVRNDFSYSDILEIGVGMQIAIPASARITDRYRGAISCTARRMSDSVTLTADAAFHLRIFSGRQPAWQSDGVIYPLLAGETYSLLPPGGKVQPRITGREEGTLIVFPLHGEPFTRVCVSFALPGHIGGSSVPGYVNVSFPPGSARWVEGDTLFDPHNRMLIEFDVDGFATIEVGFVITVPETTRADVFTSKVVMTTTSVQGEGNPCLGAGIVQSGAVLLQVDVTGSRRPKTFILHQSYPNPVNGTATIRYALPEPTDVEITVYSVLGEKVTTLVDGFRYAGQHSTNISTDALPSGVYFYRLQAGTFTQSRRMVVMR